MIKDAMNVRERATGKIYSVFPQMDDINCDGKFSLRYNIGINGHNEWTFICAIYDNKEFNEKYEVVKYQKSKGEWVPIREYRFWEDE